MEWLNSFLERHTDMELIPLPNLHGNEKLGN